MRRAGARAWLALLSGLSAGPLSPPALADDPIALEGVLAFTGAGATRVELLRVPEDGPVELIWSGEIPKPGRFSLEIPAGLGDVLLRAGADAAGDGVGPDDPQLAAPVPLSIGADPPPPLELTLIRSDLGGPP